MCGIIPSTPLFSRIDYPVQQHGTTRVDVFFSFYSDYCIMIDEQNSQKRSLALGWFCLLVVYFPDDCVNRSSARRLTDSVGFYLIKKGAMRSYSVFNSLARISAFVIHKTSKVNIMVNVATWIMAR